MSKSFLISEFRIEYGNVFISILGLNIFVQLTSLRYFFTIHI